MYVEVIIWSCVALGSLVFLGWVLIKTPDWLKKAEEAEKKKKEEAEKNMSASEWWERHKKIEEARINYEWKLQSLPQFCPSCHSLNYELNTDGSPKRHKWILDSEQVVEQKELDHATTFMGSTTVYTKEYEKSIKTYKCPKCGFKYVK